MVRTICEINLDRSKDEQFADAEMETYVCIKTLPKSDLECHESGGVSGSNMVAVSGLNQSENCFNFPWIRCSSHIDFIKLDLAALNI